MSLPSSSRARGIPPGFSGLCPTSLLLQPNPQGLRAERTHHPGQKPPKDPPLPSSRPDSGRGEAGPEMSLSPSGREGLLSSCPTGGGQGRSLMTLMSTGASSNREKRGRQGQRQRQREAEIETPKPRARTQDSLERRRVRAEAGAASEGRTGLSRGLGEATLTAPWWVGVSRSKQPDTGSCSASPTGPLYLTSHKPPGPKGPRQGGKAGPGAAHTPQHHTWTPTQHPGMPHLASLPPFACSLGTHGQRD